MERLLTELLTSQSDLVKIFDMGTIIRQLDPDAFKPIEKNQVIYPFPYQQKAWLAFVNVKKHTSEQAIFWFLKLPLDEQGFLALAARDDILNRLLMNDLAENAQDDLLKDNPFSFTPDQEKMAMLHSKVSAQLGYPPSEYYRDVNLYFNQSPTAPAWQNLGLQGITDYLERMSDAQALRLSQLLSDFPEPLVHHICRSLEHIQTPAVLEEAIQSMISDQLEAPSASPTLITSLLRGLANPVESSPQKTVIKKLLTSTFGANIEIIITLATRFQSSLTEPDTLLQLLENCAQRPLDSHSFARIISEIHFWPGLDHSLQNTLQHPKRSNELRKAIEHMLLAVRSNNRTLH